MCTATPFDLGNYDEGEGARFDSPEALVWWWAEQECEEEGEEGEYADDAEGGGGGDWTGADRDAKCRHRTLRGRGEVIDGRTGAGVGAVLDAHFSPTAPPPGGVDTVSGFRAVPGVSRAALLRIHRATLEATSTSASMSTSSFSESTSSMSTYAALKRAAGEQSGYADAKRAALSQPGLWSLSAPHRSAYVDCTCT